MAAGRHATEREAPCPPIARRRQGAVAVVVGVTTVGIVLDGCQRHGLSGCAIGLEGAVHDHVDVARQELGRRAGLQHQVAIGGNRDVPFQDPGEIAHPSRRTRDVAANADAVVGVVRSQIPAQHRLAVRRHLDSVGAVAFERVALHCGRRRPPHV